MGYRHAVYCPYYIHMAPVSLDSLGLLPWKEIVCSQRLAISNEMILPFLPLSLSMCSCPDQFSDNLPQEALSGRGPSIDKISPSDWPLDNLWPLPLLMCGVGALSPLEVVSLLGWFSWAVQQSRLSKAIGAFFYCLCFRTCLHVPALTSHHDSLYKL